MKCLNSLAGLCSSADRFELKLVKFPEDRFSCVKAQIAIRVPNALFSKVLEVVKIPLRKLFCSFERI